MKPSTNGQVKVTPHEIKFRVKEKTGQVINNPLRSVPPSMLLMVLKAASPASWRTSTDDMEKLLGTLSREPFVEYS
jgi:hypothetical protein